jgi:hypothetical protein
MLTFHQIAAHRMSSLDQVHKMLESGYRSIPQPRDTEKYANSTHFKLNSYLRLHLGLGTMYPEIRSKRHRTTHRVFILS